MATTTAVAITAATATATAAAASTMTATANSINYLREKGRKEIARQFNIFSAFSLSHVNCVNQNDVYVNSNSSNVRKRHHETLRFNNSTSKTESSASTIDYYKKNRASGDVANGVVA